MALIAVLNLGAGVGAGLSLARVRAPPPPVALAAPTPTPPLDVPDAAQVELIEDAGTPEATALVEATPDAGEPAPPAELPGLVEVAASPDPKPPTERKPRVFTVPYEPYEGSARRIIIPVTFNGSVKAKLLLDTGAPGTVIFSSLAYRLGALDTSEGRLVTIASGLGGQRAAMLVVLDSLCVDAACTEFVPATVVEQISDAFEGLVGMDFLGGYQIDLDTRRHVLTLTENHRPDSPGGHDERWWRDTFAWFAREKQSWNRMHASLVTRVERLEAPPGLNLEQTRQLLDFAAAQTRQIELLSNRLERHASFNSVPREWRQ